MISLESTVVVSKQQVSCDLAGESVILNTESGIYYGLEDAVGARIWSLLQQPRTVSDIRNEILREYDVGQEQCENDLLMLLQQMDDHQLIEVVNAAPA